jgi:hypothetical protein
LKELIFQPNSSLGNSSNSINYLPSEAHTLYFKFTFLAENESAIRFYWYSILANHSIVNSPIVNLFNIKLVTRDESNPTIAHLVFFDPEWIKWSKFVITDYLKGTQGFFLCIDQDEISERLLTFLDHLFKAKRYIVPAGTTVPIYILNFYENESKFNRFWKQELEFKLSLRYPNSRLIYIPVHWNWFTDSQIIKQFEETLFLTMFQIHYENYFNKPQEKLLLYRKPLDEAQIDIFQTYLGRETIKDIQIVSHRCVAHGGQIQDFNMDFQCRSCKSVYCKQCFDTYIQKAEEICFGSLLTGTHYFNRS